MVPGRQHGVVYSSTGYAVCLSHTHALVWPYAANSASPETFTFALPYPSRHLSDPLPLGSLVAPSASAEEPGLVVVMPTTGKITYWESISSAATLDFLRQQRHGVEDSIPGILSGEHVTQIVNAESAGFLLVFSSGRLAYMGVRDGHGRPAISIQFFRSGVGQVAGGFLGSIRHALKNSALRGDVAAVRASPATKVGERIIFAATARGKVFAWRVHRGGNHDPLVEADVREVVTKSVRQTDPAIIGNATDSFEVIDFTFVPKGLDSKYTETNRLSNPVEDDDDSLQNLLLLVSFAHSQQSRYALVELIVARDVIHVGVARPITLYSSPVNKQALERPRLYLPNPAIVAYIVFDRAVVFASLAQPPNWPDRQLQGESRVLPATYEDVIGLRNNDTLEIVGSGMEEPLGAGQEPEALRSHRHKTKNPAVILIIRGVGVVRVATSDVDRFISEKPPQVTAKSKLEQAVFFGIKDDNPLVFEGRSVPEFSSEEVGNAALQLSHEILSSTTPYIASLPASLENNLRTRTSYLDKLMSHLNVLKVKLDRRVRWALLWNAEKMVTATQFWLQHEQFIADRADTKGTEKKSMISEIVEYIHEDQKKNPNRAVGEVDRVRHWFINDIWNLEIFIAWAYEVIKYLYKDHLLDDRGITRLMHEAVEINYRGLEGALEYRKKKLPFYGLDGEDMEDGILVSGYEGLPEPWTSTHFITNNAKRLVELCCTWLDQYYPPQATANAPDPGLIESIRENLPRLTDYYLVTLQEHSRWAATRDDPQQQQYGERCAKSYNEDRYAKVHRLKDFGLWTEAVEVAEKHHSLTAMAEILVEEVSALRLKAMSRETPPGQAADMRQLANEKEAEIGVYIEKYKEPFAFSVYEVLLREEGIKAVLDFPTDLSGFATRFLRTKPELAKISWINDIERENDIDHAAETLLNLGLGPEQQIWNKKIELSLGKLALLAEQEAGPKKTSRLVTPTDAERATKKSDIENIDRHLSVIKMQDLVYNWVFPSISMAVDEAAELVLAMESHGAHVPKKQKALLQMFEDAMNRLLRHEALDAFTLIDLLTMITVKNEDISVEEAPFFLALRVAEYSLAGEEREHARRLIWRRCFIREDWALINNTELQDDESTAAAIRQTAPYATVFSLYANRKYFRLLESSFPIPFPSCSSHETSSNN